MTNINALKISLIVAGLFASILLLYLNSNVRIEIEHSVDLPAGTKVLKVESNWWIPPTNTFDRSNSATLEMERNHFLEFIESLENCRNCDSLQIENGARYSFFPVPNAGVRWIEVEESNSQFVIFRIISVYS